MSNKDKVTAIILAAGCGSRMNSEVTKQKINILGRSVLRHSVLAFSACDDIDEIVVVARASEEDFAKSQCVGIDKKFVVVTGADTRLGSAKIGFSAISDSSRYVAIHDAARCLVTPEMISNVVAYARKCGAATAATPITDTVKRSDVDGFVAATVNRDGLWAALTPQSFEVSLYKQALEALKGADETLVTDDNMLLEGIGVKVKCVDVGRENIKITRQEDIAYAEYILLGRGKTN